MSRRDFLVDSACEAISESGIGMGTAFVGLGEVVGEDCWAAAVFPLKTRQKVMNKPIRIARRIQANLELFGTD
jgi:hypothetical protein